MNRIVICGDTHGVLDTVKNKFNDFTERFGNKIDDFYQGYPTKEGQPQSIEEVFEGNGWEIILNKTNPQGTTYIAANKVSPNGVLSSKALVEDLNIFLNGKGQAIFLGQDKNKSYVRWFKID